jgi:hypothetical protein
MRCTLQLTYYFPVGLKDGNSMTIIEAKILEAKEMVRFGKYHLGQHHLTVDSATYFDVM